ncbi:MAG TPA: FAD-dependent monooxygenase [Vicinamibacterales bacterium]|nr:FAD-dependent monooxygenase [Vicinamibacterales bacterium]
MARPLNAVVIGGGIAGLTTAIALDRAGVGVDVYERVDSLGEIGAGISIWLNALRAFGEIGLADTIKSFSVPAGEAGLRTFDGRLLVGPRHTSLARRLEDVAVVMHRADLQRVLVDAFGHGRVRLGKACVGVVQDDAGVSATFADGHVARGDVLVGADGLHSAVRAALHGDRPPRYSGYTAWRGVVSFDHAKVLPGESWGPGRRFGQIPMSDGRVYWFATDNAPAGGRAAAGEKAELLRLFSGWHAPIEALVEATADRAILRNDIYDRPPLARWGDRRITLVGDAAHPMTPNLGQGACQAIEDAVALARCLKGADDVVAALRAYEASRIRRANEIAEASRRVGMIGQIENRWAIAARNTFVRLIGGRLQARAMARMIGT